MWRATGITCCILAMNSALGFRMVPMSLDANTTDSATMNLSKDRFFSRWREPWTDGEVPYIFKEGQFNEADQKLIKEHFDHIASKVGCVRFVERSARRRFVEISNDGCSATLGMDVDPGYEDHSLKLECQGRWRKYGYIDHETLHTLGMDHEHQRPDRDEFIDMNWDNWCGEYRAFKKIDWYYATGGSLCHRKMIDRETCAKNVLANLITFDIGSVAMYGPTGMSCNYKNLVTITVKKTEKTKEWWDKTDFGIMNFANPDKRISDMDVYKLKYRYGCNNDINTRYKYAHTSCMAVKISFKAGSFLKQHYGLTAEGIYKMDGNFVHFDQDSTRMMYPVYRNTANHKWFCAIRKKVKTPWNWACMEEKDGDPNSKPGSMSNMIYNDKALENGQPQWFTNSPDVTVTCEDKPDGYPGTPFRPTA